MSLKTCKKLQKFNSHFLTWNPWNKMLPSDTAADVKFANYKVRHSLRSFKCPSIYWWCNGCQTRVDEHFSQREEHNQEHIKYHHLLYGHIEHQYIITVLRVFTISKIIHYSLRARASVPFVENIPTLLELVKFSKIKPFNSTPHPHPHTSRHRFVAKEWLQCPP